MARKRKNRPSKAQPRPKNRRKGGKVQGFWLWIVVGIVVVVALFMLARTLATSTGRVPPTPMLSLQNRDLTTVTRMLGDIERDTAGIEGLPDEVRTRFEDVDSVISEGNWPEAIGLIRGLHKSVPEDNLDVYHDYLGFCFYKSASPDYALAEFRSALGTADTADPELEARMAFCIGYLFQSRGYADSALAMYALARQALGEELLTTALAPALLNNYGLAREASGDTAGAVELYDAAALLLDTTGTDRASRTLRDNIRRLSGWKPSEPLPDSSRPEPAEG
ncbi:MAG: hypothetical protein JSU73_13735 [candidate division WOR-3 bacterium]|nr:MAG: hypothetical protein JSU73_13735 [candidate division WOR-3 bacterium]